MSYTIHCGDDDDDDHNVKSDFFTLLVNGA